MTGLGGAFLRAATGGDRARRIQAAIVAGATMTTLACDTCAANKVHTLASKPRADGNWTHVTCANCGTVEAWREDKR